MCGDAVTIGWKVSRVGVSEGVADGVDRVRLRVNEWKRVTPLLFPDQWPSQRRELPLYASLPNRWPVAQSSVAKMTQKAQAGWACISGHRQQINYDCYTYTVNRNVAGWFCCVAMLAWSLAPRLESAQEAYVSWEKQSHHVIWDGDTKAHIPSPVMWYSCNSPKLHVLVSQCVTSIWSYFCWVLFASHVWGKEAHLFLALCCRWSLVWCSSFFYFGMCLCHSVSFAASLKYTLVFSKCLVIVSYCVLCNSVFAI